MFINPITLFYALLGGILPAILWLWFWLKEDSKKPEPTGIIIMSFIAGMAAVVIVLPIEKLTFNIFSDQIILLISWSMIEEIVKFSAIFIVAMQSKYFDEPVDALVYMITVALGFAALENSMFLIGPLTDGNLIGSLLTGNLRFLGATLLHTATSASVGIAIGLSFYKSRTIKILSVVVGMTVAIVLHTLFNFFIINNNGNIFSVFLFLWMTIVVVILFFEKVRRIKKT
jgi:RsiW-degrading membrane proteinase PrsW (M82 family)